MATFRAFGWVRASFDSPNDYSKPLRWEPKNMASLIKRPNGHFWVQFVLDGRRKTVRLGRITPQQARICLSRIEGLHAARKFHLPVDPHIWNWVNRLSTDFFQKLVRSGLIEDRPSATVAALVGYACKLSKLSRSTELIYGLLDTNLRAFFGEDRRLDSISGADAQEFAAWLALHGTMQGGPLGAATVYKRIRQIKCFFDLAVQRTWIKENPFSHVRLVKPDMGHRRAWVPPEAVRALESHLDPATYLVCILARWGGLRVPSETAALTWEDIDWEGRTLTVHCQKTVRYVNCQIRLVPLFPEIRTALLEWRKNHDGPMVLPEETRSVYYQRAKAGLRAAGISPWPKLFQNMRASRETELNDRFPPHVVAGWLGHSTEVAQQHYLQITDAHLDLACESPEPDQSQ